ncbi:GPP34 family phosphoprotein [Kitasatospora aureofaciens]|uniref:GOLPH3/VPS74 family protein n=1 Tax=Kitasatospora aureofaciens TaxID=1894 RepID=UPI0005266D9D|nr:GPP34 family phosphoprotein [Kitasatospora aureofaciens]HJD84211.1 GPP34 family phosphoprotein [Kitasatospora aureofaciens]
MDLPVNLPEKLYLLAHDPRRGRTTQHSSLNLLLQAAALTELLRRGLLYEEGRKAVARVRGGAAEDGLDPYSARLLGRIRESRPHSWSTWVGRARSTGRDQPIRWVRDGLADAGRITLRPHRVAGLFPVTLVTLDDPAAREALAAAVAGALKGPLSRVDPADAALTALVAAGRLRSVLSARQRREHRARIAKLAPAAGPVPRALGRALAWQMAGHAAQSAAAG